LRFYAANAKRVEAAVRVEIAARIAAIHEPISVTTAATPPIPVGALIAVVAALAAVPSKGGTGVPFGSICRLK